MSQAATPILDQRCPAKPRPVLREVRSDDAEAVHTLLTGALSDTIADRSLWQTYWDWQCWGNPFRQGRPVGWVLTEDDRLIGHIGAVYVPLRIGAQNRLGVIVSDYCIAPDAAARGGVLLGLQLAQMFFDSARDTDCLPLATTANEKTGAVFARFGCKPVTWTRGFYRMPTGLAGEMRACWGSRSRVVRRLQTGPFAHPLNQCMVRVLEFLKRRPSLHLPSGSRIEEHANVADWAGSLGLLDEQSAHEGLGLRRSADYLVWRYARHPQPERLRLLAIRGPQDAILGAAILFREERPDRRRGIVEDVFVRGDRPDVIRALLCAALRWTSDRRLDYLITMPGRESYRAEYWKTGFQIRARSAPAVLLPGSVFRTETDHSLSRSFESGLEFWHGAMF